ncbi:PH domain-containing protein [Microbacterium sp. 2FI]|uniref:PH domain-containing protein n=1 Tax=Microbacterium sp. 2FI TaxID=2502193 RepID=UPI0010F64A16|nr:PH domain-containing protein [Microbacterium sp. 2FI]
MFDPRIERHLIADQGEVVIDEVRKHWAAVVAATLELGAGMLVTLLATVVPPVVWWLPALVGVGVILHASWRILEQRMNRFVITNMRVFRVHGILSQRIATMPLARILDISVHKPLVGRIFGYGHFIFESAAQSQGLREIRYVGDPDGRGLTIQRVIQQSGLRGFVADQSPSPRVARPPLPPAPTRTASDAPGGWEWLAGARRREDERLAELRGEQLTEPIPPYDPDRTTTAPIDLPR